MSLLTMQVPEAIYPGDLYSGQTSSVEYIILGVFIVLVLILVVKFLEAILCLHGMSKKMGHKPRVTKKE
jgi:hypothetical protein